MTAKFLVSCLLFIGCVAGQNKPAPQRGLLEFKLVTLSKNERGDALTAAIKITNKTALTYFLLLVGKPHAVDDAGGEYDVVQSVDGVAYCKGYDSYHGEETTKSVCVDNNPKDKVFVPLDHYTEIDPDASANFTIVLHGRHSDGKTITLTQEIAARIVKDVDADNNVPEAAKLKSLRFRSLDFNAKLQEVVSSTISQRRECCARCDGIGEQRDGHVSLRQPVAHDARAHNRSQKQGGAQSFSTDFAHDNA